jgi:hypothetical protein
MYCRWPSKRSLVCRSALPPCCSRSGASALTVLRPRFFLAGQDLFPFEITPIRDNLEILAVRRGLCLLRHARELAAVIADIGNLVGDNEVLLATLPDLAGTWLQLCCCRGTVYVPVRLLAGATPPQARLALLIAVAPMCARISCLKSKPSDRSSLANNLTDSACGQSA